MTSPFRTRSAASASSAAAEPLSMKAVVDGKATDQRCRQEWITRQAFDDLGRQIVGVYAGRRERVVAGDPVRRNLHGHEATRHEPPHILRGLFAQVPVERRRPACEGGTVVGAERLDRK